MTLPTADAQLEAFCRRWRIAELSVFGSTARGEAGPDSDIDVLVRFEPEAPWSAFDLVDLRDELEDLWDRPVDLIEEAGLRNPFRRAAILKERRRLYTSEAHPDIPWRLIIAQRNVIAHEYGEIVQERLWRVAREHIPTLIADLERLLPEPPDV